MRKGRESVYVKWNISVVICDTHNGQPCHGDDRKTFEVVTSTLKCCLVYLITVYQLEVFQCVKKKNKNVYFVCTLS